MTLSDQRMVQLMEYIEDFYGYMNPQNQVDMHNDPMFTLPPGWRWDTSPMGSNAVLVEAYIPSEDDYITSDDITNINPNQYSTLRHFLVLHRGHALADSQTNGYRPHRAHGLYKINKRHRRKTRRHKRKNKKHTRRY